MKKILALFASLLISVSVFGQGTAIRAQNGQGTNTTIFNGFTLSPGNPALLRGVTNVGPMLFWLGSGALGTQLSFLGTNGLPRITVTEENLKLLDKFGSTRINVGDATSGGTLNVTTNGRVGINADPDADKADFSLFPNLSINSEDPQRTDLAMRYANVTPTMRTFYSEGTLAAPGSLSGFPTPIFSLYNWAFIEGSFIPFTKLDPEIDANTNGIFHFTTYDYLGNFYDSMLTSNRFGEFGHAAFIGFPGSGQTVLAGSGGIFVPITNTVSIATDSSGKMLHGGFTNTWGNAVIPFDRGPNLRTNMAGNLTITGVTGFQNNVYNTVFVRLVAGGSDRTLVVPDAWLVNTNTIPVNTFTNATTATIAANTLAWLMVEMLPGIETNAYLLGSYP